MKAKSPGDGEYEIVPSNLSQHVQYPTCSGTQTYSWVAIFVSVLGALSCFIFAGIILTSDPSFDNSDFVQSTVVQTTPIFEAQLIYRTSLSQVSAEVLAFTISLVVTNCSDALGFVHATSLRWALYRENRLEYNTSLRLFRSAKTSLPNRWFMNILFATSLVMCYASTSALFMRVSVFAKEDPTGNTRTTLMCLNPVAMCFLGVGLAGQVTLAIFCLRNSEKLIPTWSSNPLVNTLVSLKYHTGITHRPGRCMRSVGDTDETSGPCMPRKRQQSLWNIPGVPWVMRSIWLICALPLVWASIVASVSTQLQKSSGMGSVVSWDGDSLREGVIMHLEPAQNERNSTISYSGATQCILAVLFLFGIQAVQATGLHCMELIVIMSRDEHVWTRSATKKGTSLATNPLVAAATSWQAIALVFFKAGLHWLVGQAVSFNAGFGIMAPPHQPDRPLDEWVAMFYWKPSMSFYMSTARLIAYAIAAAIAAIFITCLAVWPRTGLQPASWGNLQTLADLVDEWPTPDQRLWWGDKGVGEYGIRHAGTSTQRDALGDIDPTATYAGTGGTFRATATRLAEEIIPDMLNISEKSA